MHGGEGIGARKAKVERVLDLAQALLHVPREEGNLEGVLQ